MLFFLGNVDALHGTETDWTSSDYAAGARDARDKGHDVQYPQQQLHNAQECECEGDRAGGSSQLA